MPEITLSELLEAKEDRVRRRAMLHQECPGTCLSLSLNIPGARKDSPRIRALFRYALDCIAATLCVLTSQTVYGKTGPHALIVVEEDAVTAKAIACHLETEKDFSRLLDIDVYDATGKAVASPDRKSGRSCFLCPELAVVCMREARHSPQEISLGIEHLFTSFQTALGRDISK